MSKHPPIIENFPHFLHGGDYNPDQWLDRPDILDEDLRLTKLAGCNTFSIGIFAWTSYEKSEGKFNFDWLDRVMDNMAAAGNKVMLATPSGARPAWMARKYPEIQRVDAKGLRDHFRARHNHCWSSPVYREKVTIINTKLAKRYGQHPALGAWHVSNEYSGDCYCELCKANFREFLRRKYGTLDALNAAYWSAFWSHTYTSWDEIEPDDPFVDGLALDFRRFNTWQICDFMHMEAEPLRFHSKAPVTTNMMGFWGNFNYFRLAEECDFIADDRYPGWLNVRDFAGTASLTSMIHDMHRAMKQKPFVLMESTPSNLNWQPYYRLKRPGLHRAEALLAVGHGADAVMYFQIRKGRGGSEKLHGAVIDHEGSENTRVFREVAEVGEILKKIEPVRGTMTDPDVALIYEWESNDALRLSGGPSDSRKLVDETLADHYRAFWEMNIPCDVIESTMDFSPYKVVVAPMLYMLKPGVAAKIKEFVAAGGVWISGYLSNYVNDTNLHFLAGLPGDGLREVFGIWSEELDGLTPEDKQCFEPVAGNPLSFEERGLIVDFAERIHLEGAEMLARYGEDFYAGEPALTCNRFGKGYAYYQAARGNLDFLRHFYGRIAACHGLKPLLATPRGVHATIREAGRERFVFIYNFTAETRSFLLGDFRGKSLLDGKECAGSLTLAPFGSDVLKI
ncbi:MAG: beta-galactosidase [Victivallaceae bacterium]